MHNWGFMHNYISDMNLSHGDHSALPHQMRRYLIASFREDVKPLVPGDLDRLASGYSRPMLATNDSGKPEMVITHLMRFATEGT